MTVHAQVVCNHRIVWIRFKDWGLGVGVSNSGFRVSEFEVRRAVSYFSFQVEGSGSRVSGFGRGVIASGLEACRILLVFSGFGFPVPGSQVSTFNCSSSGPGFRVR